jgi:hypothetical protein
MTRFLKVIRLPDGIIFQDNIRYSGPKSDIIEQIVERIMAEIVPL